MAPRRAALAMLFAAFSVIPGSAAADDHWYGWQTLVADGAALGVGVGASALGSRTGVNLGIVALASYLITAPVIHAEHGNYERSAGSLAMRLAAPALGYGIGYGIGAWIGEDRWGRPASGTGGAFGVLGGIALAVALDSAVLAYEPRAAATPRVLAFAGSF